MEKLRLRSNETIARTKTDFVRDFLTQFGGKPRLFGIKGSRGTGKTTLILQHIQRNFGFNEEAIYISLDDIYFSEHTLTDFVTSFRRLGGKHLYLDEVHRYPNWAIEIKNIYDRYNDLDLVFTGSSMLQLQQFSADLSRRAVILNLQGLSFREYLGLRHKIRLPLISLLDVIERPNQIIGDLPKEFLPYPYWIEYVRSGYYPFFTEGDQWYFEKLENTIQTVVERDLAQGQSIEHSNLLKLYRLLYVLATSPPFKPNISKLSERLGIARNTLLRYIDQLCTAGVLQPLHSSRKGLTSLQKPQKLYLENSNLIFTYHPTTENWGTIRETVVLNQLKEKHLVTYPDQGDFLVDETYLFEVGGSSEGKSQISGHTKSFIIADNLDFAVGRKLPIWLFGLLY